MIFPIERALQMQIDEPENSNSGPSTLSELKCLMIYCRILGYFIHHGPNDTARGVFVDEILSTGGDRVKLLQLGEMYYDYFT